MRRRDNFLRVNAGCLFALILVAAPAGVDAEHSGDGKDGYTFPGNICEPIGEESLRATNTDRYSDFQNVYGHVIYANCPLTREDLGHARPKNDVDVYVRDYHSDKNVRCALDYTFASGETALPSWKSTSGESSAGNVTKLSFSPPSSWDESTFAVQFSVVCEVPEQQDGKKSSSIVAIKYTAKTHEAPASNQKAYPGSYCQIGNWPTRTRYGNGTGDYYWKISAEIMNSTSGRLYDIYCPVVRDDRESSSFMSSMSWHSPLYVLFEDEHPDQNIRCRRVVRYTDGSVNRGGWASSASAPGGEGIGVLAPPATGGSYNANANFSLRCELPPEDSDYNASSIIGYVVAE